MKLSCIYCKKPFKKIGEHKYIFDCDCAGKKGKDIVISVGGLKE